MNIQILIDNPSSWIFPYAEMLKDMIIRKGHSSKIITKHIDVQEGDILLDK